jgi:hypothetical protein
MRHIANDHLLLRDPAVIMQAAREARAKELARLTGKAARAISGLFHGQLREQKTGVDTFKSEPANTNKKKDEHYLAA